VQSDEHYTLSSGAYVEFTLDLEAGDQVRWVTQTAWDTGIAEILLSADGESFAPLTQVDAYSASLAMQQEFAIFTADTPGTYSFRVRHSGTINPAGNIAPGWQRLQSRFSAGQTDVLLGLTAMWLMTREPRYAALAARIARRFPSAFWSEPGQQWLISLDAAAPGTPNLFWYPMPHGYTAFGQMQSRFFQPRVLNAQALESLAVYEADGAFQPPGYAEAEYIFSAFYALGENQLASPTDAQRLERAKAHIKAGQYLSTLGGEAVGGIAFSRRYPYLYTNIAGFSESRIVRAA
jgi:hypothetical protein